ncbi:MAG TPA: aldehyde dehydrogenase family protein, partial [Terriglobia bacterium]|nr:aldehyde dehydrogenase family protein [Terriglobia bacterium]
MSERAIEIPLIIGGGEVRTGQMSSVVMPHDHGHVLAKFHKAGAAEVNLAIQAAADAHREWASRRFEDRVAVFLRAADMLSSSWRDTVNGATMLNQSKTAHQAEIDSACEMIDFLRFNVSFARQIHAEQPLSPEGVKNVMDYRPLEGFVYAVTPFNFTSIAGNLPSAPAIMGNTVVWKCASSTV